MKQFEFIVGNFGAEKIVIAGVPFEAYKPKEVSDEVAVVLRKRPALFREINPEPEPKVETKAEPFEPPHRKGGAEKPVARKGRKKA